MSSKYHIFETRGFLKDLSEINVPSSKNIFHKLSSYVYPILKEQPHFGTNIKKLKSWHPETWRYRIGDWRFFYEIDEKEKIIYLTVTHHRKESY